MSIFGIKGVHVPHRKHTASCHAVRMPVPKTVVLPMNMHIGAPAKPVVSVGDTVGVGQLIAEAGDPTELTIEHLGSTWVITGTWLERLVMNINFDDYESRNYFDQQLLQMMIQKKAERLSSYMNHQTTAQIITKK